MCSSDLPPFNTRPSTSGECSVWALALRPLPTASEQEHPPIPSIPPDQTPADQESLTVLTSTPSERSLAQQQQKRLVGIILTPPDHSPALREREPLTDPTSSTPPGQSVPAAIAGASEEVKKTPPHSLSPFPEIPPRPISPLPIIPQQREPDPINSTDQSPPQNQNRHSPVLDGHLSRRPLKASPSKNQPKKAQRKLTLTEPFRGRFKPLGVSAQTPPIKEAADSTTSESSFSHISVSLST